MIDTPMHVCTTIEDVDRILAPHRRAPITVGFVPTLGALHEGHLSLVRRARDSDAIVVVSIFLNPTQFAPSEDVDRYPRTPERDLALLRSEGVDVLFMPSVEEMYPVGFETRIDVGRLGTVWEGVHRPGHFVGVATVVAKLLGIVRPTHAYFGQKDAQQLAVIRRLVRDLNLPVHIVGCPTMREADGLAMSSRNVYLSAEERRAATVLYRALTAARDTYVRGEREALPLCQVMRHAIEAEPLAHLDYAEAVTPDTLQSLRIMDDTGLFIVAALFGRTRLIDNERCLGL